MVTRVADPATRSGFLADMQFLPPCMVLSTIGELEAGWRGSPMGTGCPALGRRARRRL